MNLLKAALFALLLAPPGLASAAAPAKPLFADNSIMRLTIKGPLSTLMRNRQSSRLPGTMAVVGGEALPVALSVRGITRRQSEVCDFPPLRVELQGAAPPTSLFAGQRRLKLVTHCRSNASFQKHVLLEYAAYRMYNVLSPMSFRARLAQIDYQDADGRPVASRYGFFIEEIEDVAARNGLREPHTSDRVPLAYISPADGTRMALFMHMLGNHDWSMRAGPAGERCCHNSRLIGPPALAAGSLVPVPYDFDFSGFVNAPYAEPPSELNLSSVRERLYRGYCIHNAHAPAAIAQVRAQQGAILAVLNEVPLEEKARRDAAAYLASLLSSIATDKGIAKTLSTCLR